MRDSATLQQSSVSGQQDSLLVQADIDERLVVGVTGPPHVEPEHSKQPRQPTEVDVDDEARITQRHRPQPGRGPDVERLEHRVHRDAVAGTRPVRKILRIATSSWESEEAMHASEESIRPIRDRAAELFGGSAEIEEWEIAAMHREHRAGEGACVRITWVKVDPDQIDRGIDFYKSTILPALEELEGFCSASLLVDRASGRGVAAASFDNAEAIERNKDQLDRIRATGSQEANAEVLDQCDFELTVAHLRVPEMV
jgi:hypothetical protein